MLELVATMPSIPLVGGVLVTLDIGSRSVRLIPLPSHARDARSATFFYTLKVPAFQPPGYLQMFLGDCSLGTDWSGGRTAAMCRIASSPWTVAGFGNGCGNPRSYRVRADELRGPNTQRGLAQDLLLQVFTQRERPEFSEILLE